MEARLARELPADPIMEVLQPKEALRAYRHVLTEARGRRNALKGAAEAERVVGMSSEMMEIRRFSQARKPIE